MSYPTIARVGQRLTDYTVVDVEVQRAAGGGFGLVFMGPNRLDNGRWYALKTLRPEVLARSPRAHDRFIREALTWHDLRDALRAEVVVVPQSTHTGGTHHDR